jgi:putative FmdB family regulatory protein
VPTYPYACTACGYAFEVQQSFSDPSLTECPECTGRLRKVYSSVGVVFKGSGFYRTDSRSGSGSADGGSGAKGDGGSGAKSEGAKADGGKSDGGKGDSTPTSGGGKAGASAGSSSSGSSSATSAPAAAAGS